MSGGFAARGVDRAAVQPGADWIAWINWVRRLPCSIVTTPSYRYSEGAMERLNDIIDRILEFLGRIDALIVGMPEPRNKK